MFERLIEDIVRRVEEAFRGSIIGRMTRQGNSASYGWIERYRTICLAFDLDRANGFYLGAVENEKTEFSGRAVTGQVNGSAVWKHCI